MFVRKYFLIIKNLLKIANAPKSIKLKFIILIIMVEDAVKIIRLARKEKNYSQEYVALRLNISQSYYGRIENGKVNLDLKILNKILEILEIDYVEFFTSIKKYKK